MARYISSGSLTLKLEEICMTVINQALTFDGALRWQWELDENYLHVCFDLV